MTPDKPLGTPGIALRRYKERLESPEVASVSAPAERPWTCAHCKTKRPGEFQPAIVERGKRLVKICPSCFPAYRGIR